MKKWAIILNTNEVGGAERSLIEQFKHEKKYFDFFVPQLSLDQKIEVQLKKNFPKNKIINFEFPHVLYQVSRKKYDLWKYLLIALSLWPIYQSSSLFNHKLKPYRGIYMNGNKAAIWAILSLFVHGQLRHKALIWHFRDYPGKLVHLFLSILPNSVTKRLTVVANSHDVAKAISPMAHKLKELKVLYNLSGFERDSETADREIKKIGVVGMFSPWKGQHQIILMAKLFEDDLKKIGIEEIIFYGREIYSTNGEHQGYLKELQSLTRKLNLVHVRFVYDAGPEKIFSEIDLLIHSSIEAEPFGRVVLEAMAKKIPVLTTGLGGVSELIENGKSGGLFFPFQYAQLFKLIFSLKKDDQYKKRLVSFAKERESQFEMQALKVMEKLLDDSEEGTTLMEL